jgi:ATP-dependent Clp protease ATP-binding subunit ClpX
VKPRSPEDALKCSFCHKSQDKVAKLIGSPPKRVPSAYICDECVAVCNSILGQDARPAMAADSTQKTETWLHRVKSWLRYDMIEDIVFKH